MDREHRYLLLSMGCREGKAVRLEDGHPIEGETILQICQHGGDKGADGLFIFDLSQDDADHERTIHTIKEIARQVDVPIITGGRVKRLEDVKKYLYAGASAVFLDMGDEEHVGLVKEASSRFGSEKIFAYIPAVPYLSRVAEYVQLGVSKVIVDSAGLEKELAKKTVRDTSWQKVPFLVLERVAAGAERVSGAEGAMAERGSGAEGAAAVGASGVKGSAVCPDPDGSYGTHELSDKLFKTFQLGDNIQGAILYLSWMDHCMELKQTLKVKGLPMETFTSSISWDQFKLNSDGLIPVIVQDDKTNEVLMMAYMNEEAFEKTLATGTMTYYSRSRQKLWLKGETSGHFQYVRSLSLDCDNDTILAKVHQIGAACHTGNRSCFFKTLAAKEHKEKDPLKVFEEEYAVIKDRKEHPKEGSYTNYLFDKGIDKILKKCGEEATEIIIAAKNPDPEEIKYEIADFLYHMMVLMVEKQITWEEITKEVADR